MAVVTKNTGKKILIIEDEKHIAEAIKLNLRMLGHDVLHALNGLEGLNYYGEYAPELVIVDLMMPEIDGFGVITEIRKRDPKIPILVISAKEQVKEKIKCLSLGVDDYLSKPFDLDEFLLRVDRLLTRMEWNTVAPEDLAKQEEDEIALLGESYEFGDHQVDFKNLKAYSFKKSNPQNFDLTLQEIKILKVFFAHPNMPLTREEILEKAVGYDRGVSTRTLDNFIVRFRKYFESDPKDPKFFKSVRSVGYLFDRQGE
ncbi:DNA-binding response regulator [Bacteriovorax stolpii]|uniref:DNA-binding response regulator n=1 Tax=Bacteriovorax stolpii TaxID=960 RepID=A0A2K9NU97_BACTC|nr:response regulator transcription factor [Bacteriovorax stolpii]AUN98665.1 DNA-binding response regulator [Bacteriovorax stolpii]QDK41355.1 DNA-binding response regulator [Bacteriovorax stolpii]TDP55827.1 DNA-binding response OmpR family regulator [Bacteriovorax stolpii]